ncbi:MAG TPA: hypothetical protein DER58_10010 [Firmicutes bacterium]|nr:hypothetical protein [Bacillota bacterium]
MKHEITCTACPMGCRITVELEEAGGVRGGAGAGGESGVSAADVSNARITGNSCRRGAEYAWEEITAPKRVVTSVVAVKGQDRMLPVRTAQPIPKECIFAVMDAIQRIEVSLPVQTGQILVSNIAGTGVNLTASKNMMDIQGGFMRAR